MQRYRADDLIQFGTDTLVKAGFPEKQARAVSLVLVEADLRGDPAHGIAGGNTLPDFISKVHDDERNLGFRRVETAEFTIDEPKYPTILTVDAQGSLGHYVALEIIPWVVETAKKLGYAKAYIRNSNHFGDCGIYSEWIAQADLAAKVTCTAPPWTKAFVELIDKENEHADPNKRRYDGVAKRFGTNPIAWSIPYEGGIITIDMAATQRAVSPALEVARFNSQALNLRSKNGAFFIGDEQREINLAELHLPVARSATSEEALQKLGVTEPVKLHSVEEGLLKGPEGEEIRYPLIFDEVFKKEFWIAPLGGAYFGYKGFGLNMIIELDNVIGGGVPGLIRVLDSQGNPTTTERVSQTIEAYALDALYPLEEAKEILKKSVDTTLECGNGLMFLPGQKEQETRKQYLAHGVPMTDARVEVLRRTASDKRVNMPFLLQPL